jgi:hypothetical protein
VGRVERAGLTVVHDGRAGHAKIKLGDGDGLPEVAIAEVDRAFEPRERNPLLLEAGDV